MEADKARLGGGVFPFPFCVPSSSPSSVFPQMPMFNPGFQQMCANLFHQQLMQMAQQQQSPGLDISPSMSDRASSRGESPSAKKLQLDESGCPICPLCCEKMLESAWVAHVEIEKKKLLDVIQGVKLSQLAEVSASDQNRRKREMELSRIKNNQMKRLALKRGAPVIRDSLTPFSRQSNEESGSSGSPEVKKEDESFGNIKCASCLRSTDYGIVSSSFDQPRCQQCFNQLKVQTNSLPTSITSLLDLRMIARTPSPSTSHSPPEKKIRVE